MPKTVGLADRRVRIGVAVVLVLLVTDVPLDGVPGALAVVMAATWAVGTCPLYPPFGIDTHRS